MANAEFQVAWKNWNEEQRGGAAHYSIKLTPLEQEVVIDRSQLVDVRGPQDAALVIFNAMRPYAVAAYNHYIGAAIVGIGLALKGVEPPDFLDIIVERQARDLDQLRERNGQLAGELLETKGRLEELRRLVRPTEIVSDEEPFLSRREAAIMREAGDRPGIAWWFRADNGEIMECDSEKTARAGALANKGHYWYGTRLKDVAAMDRCPCGGEWTEQGMCKRCGADRDPGGADNDDSSRGATANAG